MMPSTIRNLQEYGREKADTAVTDLAPLHRKGPTLASEIEGASCLRIGPPVGRA